MTSNLTVTAPFTLHWHGAPVATDREILRTIVGSTVHGLAIEGQDDLDLLGIYVETADDVCGIDVLSERLASYYVARSQPDGKPSGPGDVDLVVYSLRRYLKLAASGNPTLLLSLFAPEDAVKTAHEPYAQMLREAREEFVTLAAGKSALGYLTRQRRNFLHAPENMKPAAHAVRIGLQAAQLMVDGEITLPMPEKDRERVMRVRRGELTADQVTWQIERVEDQLAAILAQAREEDWWPEQPDRERIRSLSARIHRAYWSEVDDRES
jgi:predicted nucleotidyltransferase